MSGEANTAPVRSVKRSRRLLAFVLLQLALIFACVDVRQLPLPRPPSEFLVSTVEQQQMDGHWTAVRLPAAPPTKGQQMTSVDYRASFRRPEMRADDRLSVFVPRFSTAVRISVNGTTIEDTMDDPSKRRPDRNSPLMVPIPYGLLNAGDNEIQVHLSVWGPLDGYLDSLYIGPDADMRRAYDLRRFVFETVPLTLATWQVTFGTVLGFIWFNRRQDRIYGFLALATVMGISQHFIGLPQTPMMAAVLGALGPLESALMLYYVLLLAGREVRSWHGLALVPALLLLLSGMVVSPENLRWIYFIIGPPSIGIQLALVWSILGKAAWDGRPYAAHLATVFTVVLTGWCLDVLTIANLFPGERIFLGRLSYSVVLVALGLWLIWRFVQALSEADAFAKVLVERVAQAEEKLKASFAREQDKARAETLLTERTRLMRDLHDGLGGNLVSIVALAEKPEVKGAVIADAARAALRHMRLVVDALEETEGDLLLALASWRDRIEAQLRAHNIRLDWIIRNPYDLPTFQELRPWHVIQLIRILDEAVTNVVKHSGARTLAIVIEADQDPTSNTVMSITVRDDGKGFKQEEIGAQVPISPISRRGIENMRWRASACGVWLTIRSSGIGTVVELKLPAVFDPGRAISTDKS